MSVDEGSLLAVERQHIILNFLLRDGVVRNNMLKEVLGVSVATIRADLRELESTGACEIVWGGAVAKNLPNVGRRPHPEGHLDTAQEAKQRIGARAAQLVEAGQTLIIDAGSTTVELVHHLPVDIQDLRIVTSSLNIGVAAAQHPTIELIMTGGILRHLTRSLIGIQVQNALHSINADWTFLAAGGFSIEQGISTSNALEAEVKKTMLERAEKVVVLADSSKFGRVLSMGIAPLSAIDVLITDVNLSDRAASEIEAQGVDILRV